MLELPTVMTDAHDDPPSQVHAVVDSNVMLELCSCADIVRAYDEQLLDPAGAEAILRRQKARESLLLSVYLNSIGATTFSLFEAVRITLRAVDPDATATFSNHVTTIWANYVKDEVLPDWRVIGPPSGTLEPTGSGADALLVAQAKAFGVPLISHEGVKTWGTDANSGIRKKAAAAGVDVVTPREFYGDMDELLQSALFMQRYGRGAEAWVAGAAKPDVMRESMLLLQGYYRHILYGITQGLSEPLQVRLAPEI